MDKNQNDEWVQVGSTIYGSNNNDLSGYSISLSSDGSVVAIGSIKNDDNGEDSGHVRIFKNNDGSWQQIGESIEGQNIGDNFGNAINLSTDGTFIAIGANLNDSNGNSSGNVRVFQNNNNKWEQIGSSIDGEFEGDLEMGSSIASGSQVIGGGTDGDPPLAHVPPLRSLDF